MFRTVSYNMLLLAYTEYTAWRLILDFSCHLSPIMHVTYVCRMYWWFSKACCGDLLLWGTSGGVCEWSVGICVSWFLVNSWCSCGLQTAWILNLWYICCALVHAICVASFSSLPHLCSSACSALSLPCITLNTNQRAKNVGVLWMKLHFCVHEIFFILHGHTLWCLPVYL